MKTVAARVRALGRYGHRGAVALIAVAAVAICGGWVWLDRLGGEAGSGDDGAAARARWERRWIMPLDPNLCSADPATTSRFAVPDAEHAFSVAGGTVELVLHPARGGVTGRWTLARVESPWGWLHATLPPGMTLRSATAAGVRAEIDVDADNGHVAIPLDACARQACDVTLSFDGVPGGQAEGGAMWLRAVDVLPRLGLDGDRLLRDPAQRQAQGLPAFLTLPDAHAGVAAAGVAPAGQWHWQIRTDEQADAGRTPFSGQGRTDGVLDFVVAQAPRLRAATVAGLGVVQEDTPGSAAAAALAADVEAMQACLARRMGGTAVVDTVLLAPDRIGDGTGVAGLPAAHLAGGTLWLPQSLRDDRAGRRAALAQAIAVRHVADRARLRHSRGAQWLAEGLPGAVALLCVAEVDGADAVRPLLQQAALRTEAALRARADELGAVAYAAFDGWVREYAPLAALDAVRRLSGDQIRTLLDELGQGVRMQYALANAMGAQRAALVLSMPLATDLRVTADGRVEGDRWRWQQGKWSRLSGLDKTWTMAPADGGTAGLHLDGWPGYERNFADNVARR